MGTVIVVGMTPCYTALIKMAGKSQVERSQAHLQPGEKTSFLRMDTGFGSEARVSDGRRPSLRPDLECFMLWRTWEVDLKMLRSSCGQAEI